MITVQTLMQKLKQYPPNALVYAYEGEGIGIVIVSAANAGPREQIDFIPASESDERDAMQAEQELHRRKKTSL